MVVFLPIIYNFGVIKSMLDRWAHLPFVLLISFANTKPPLQLFIKKTLFHLNSMLEHSRQAKE